MFVCPVCATTAAAGGFCTEDGTVLVDGATDALLGTTVGSYRLARLFGKGGMGAVYLGVHPGIGSRVAVKVLSPSASSDPTLVERFFAEARAVNVIRHESIVNVLDLSVLPDGRPCITMEYLEGAPLSRHFAEGTPSPLEFVARVAVEVLGALAAAHALGITHRDLKPDNVFITALGRVKVLDFGIAKLRPSEGNPHDATATGALLGTPQYMSPEQALGQVVDTRSDLYSLGAILYEGVTGQRLFRAESLFELLRAHIERAPLPPRSLRPDLPPAFEGLLLRMLEKDRERRTQTAEECRAALLAVQPEAGRGVSLPPPTALSQGASSSSSSGRIASSASVPATVAATSVTLSAPESPRSSSSSSVGIFVGVGGLLVAFVVIVVVVVGGGVAYTLSKREPPATPTATPTSTTTTTSEPGSTGTSQRVDLTAELAEARRAARKQFPDAELTTLSATGVDSTGKVDLSVNTKSVAYFFRSPAASKTTKKCVVSVSLSGYGTFATPYEDTVYECKQPTISAPRCMAARVVKEEAGTSEIVSVTFQNQAGAWQWVVMLKGGALRIRPDNC
jgi:serine/threonine protein kinase